jgi:hypothetical protein
MFRSLAAGLAATAALSLAACGGADDGGAGHSAASVKSSLENAAGVHLVALPIPADAREQGLTASYSNEKSVLKDGQLVAMFMTKDAETAGGVRRMVSGQVPAGAKLLVHDNVIVLYKANGEDHAKKVQQAVDGI